MSHVKIENKKHDQEWSLASQCGSGYMLDEISDVGDDFYTFPSHSWETELGVYTVQLCHGVTNSTIRPFKIDFTPHEKRD